MSEPVIQVENLGKRYRLSVRMAEAESWHQAVGNLFSSPFNYLREVTRPPTEEEALWALRDISFEVNRGEVIGLIGRNGAGKSTLLKILSRITEPSEGRAILRGRVGALLEVGTGFNPELTGRDNIYLSGSILGMTRHEINRKLDDIVEFAEIDAFIDTPVKRYSSGMYVRLAFAIAAHLEPEVLILDEVLAVGDIGFQQKCLKHLSRLRADGMTIFLVSHNIVTIQAVCSRAILLHKGRLVANSNPLDVINQYKDYLEPTPDSKSDDENPNRSSAVQVTGFEMYGENGEPTRELNFGEAPRIRIELNAAEAIPSPMINFGLRRADGVAVCGFNNLYDDFRIERIEGHCVLEGWLPPLRLIPDFYEIHVLVWYSGGHWGGGAKDGDLFKAIPIFAQTFGSLRVRGVGLNAHDGVFQVPARKWVLTTQNQAIEYDDMDEASIKHAFQDLVGTK